MIDIKTVEQIARGVAYVSENNGCVQFHRFTPKEEAYYNKRVGKGIPRHYATSGVKLSFVTNSTTLSLKVNVVPATPTNYFSHDILVNGRLVGSIKNYTVERPIARDPHPFGSFEGSFELGEGEKEVTVVFPWSVNSMLEELTLQDGSYILPYKRLPKMLTYGDSITYGAAAALPSNRHCFRLSEALDVEEVCKAVGAEIFCPGLLTGEKEDGIKYILVAYGTNEVGMNLDEFKSRSALFLEKTVEIYPNTPVFVLAPIWCKECEMPEHTEKIKTIKKHIETITALHKNTVFIDCIDFVPHDPALFMADCIHPTDKGLEYYFENLKNEIIKFK